jgi:hypothetical protein
MHGRHWSSSDAQPVRCGAVYDREGDGLAGNGLYLDMPTWGCHLLDITDLPPG